MESRSGTPVYRSGRVSYVLFSAFFLTLLFTVVPTAHAEAGVFAHAEIDLSPEVFTARLFGETREGDDAVRFREIVDEDHGDADGTVTQTEVDAYRQAKVDDFNAQLSNPFAKALVEDFMVNGRSPLEVRVTDVQVSDNVLGPTTADSTLTRDIVAEMRYASTTRDRANVTFANDFRQAFVGMEWGYALFSGKAPWAIDPETIDPTSVRDTFWTGDGFNVTYSETPEFASGFDPLSFQLHDTTAKSTASKDGKKDSPGPALPLILLAIALVALVARRR